MKPAQYLSRDFNLMDVVVRSVDITSFVRHPAPLLCEDGLTLKITGYNLEGVLHAILDDYGMERIIKELNNLRTEFEPEIIYDASNEKGG